MVLPQHSIRKKDLLVKFSELNFEFSGSEYNFVLSS